MFKKFGTQDIIYLQSNVQGTVLHFFLIWQNVPIKGPQDIVYINLMYYKVPYSFAKKFCTQSIVYLVSNVQGIVLHFYTTKNFDME